MADWVVALVRGNIETVVNDVDVDSATASPMLTEVEALSCGCPKRRVYVVSIGKDLFGCPFVKREYGHVSKSKTVRISYFSSEDGAKSAAKRLIKAAKRRGYELDG